MLEPSAEAAFVPHRRGWRVKLEERPWVLVVAVVVALALVATGFVLAKTGSSGSSVPKASPTGWSCTSRHGPLPAGTNITGVRVTAQSATTTTLRLTFDGKIPVAPRRPQAGDLRVTWDVSLTSAGTGKAPYIIRDIAFSGSGRLLLTRKGLGGYLDSTGSLSGTIYPGYFDITFAPRIVPLLGPTFSIATTTLVEQFTSTPRVLGYQGLGTAACHQTQKTVTTAIPHPKTSSSSGSSAAPAASGRLLSIKHVVTDCGSTSSPAAEVLVNGDGPGCGTARGIVHDYLAHGEHDGSGNSEGGPGGWECLAAADDSAPHGTGTCGYDVGGNSSDSEYLSWDPVPPSAPNIPTSACTAAAMVKALLSHAAPFRSSKVINHACSHGFGMVTFDDTQTTYVGTLLSWSGSRWQFANLIRSSDALDRMT